MARPRDVVPPGLPPQTARRLACLTLAIEMRRAGEEQGAIIARAQSFDDWARNYGLADDEIPAGRPG